MTNCLAPLWAPVDSPTKWSHQRLFSALTFCAFSCDFFTDVQLWILADCVTGLVSRGVDELLVSWVNAKGARTMGCQITLNIIVYKNSFQQAETSHTHARTCAWNAHPDKQVHKRTTAGRTHLNNGSYISETHTKKFWFCLLLYLKL